MKKNLIIGSVVVIVLICVFLILKFVSFGIKESIMGASIIPLEVPKMARVKSECCSYSATFSCISSVSIIEEELENIMSKYQKISCNGKEYYYNAFEDITILEYSIESGFIYNTFKIDYTKGNYCNS